MNILVDARFLSTPPDGITRYIEAILAALALKPEIETKVVIRNSGQARRVLAPVALIHSVHPTGPTNQLRAFPLARAAREFDLYHFPHFDLPLLVPNGVMTVHDLKLVHQSWKNTSFSSGRHAYFRQMLRLAVRRARAITVPSEYTKRTLLDYTGIAEDKVFVTPIPLGAAFVRELTHQHEDCHITSRSNVTSDAERPFILYVGTNRPNKNLPRLLEAYSLLITRYRLDLDLRIVGTDYSHSKTGIAELVRNHFGENAQRVLVMGPVAETELVELYKRALALVMPSTYEGFGIPIIEAMACGTPVVTSNVTSLPEVGGDAAMYVDPGSAETIADGIFRVVSDNSLALLLARRGRERAKRYTLKTFLEHLMPAYDYALGRRDGRGPREKR